MNTEIEVIESDRLPATLVPSSDVSSKCGLCHRGHVSHPLAAGKLYRISFVDGIFSFVHYFCMLFSAYAKQIGDDNEGLFGFYGSEIINQINLARKKKCLYCGKTGATARCATKRCTSTMHFQCGIERGATFQFHTTNMYVYCAKDRCKQKCDKYPSPPDRDCVICYDQVSQELRDFERIRVPCCGRFFHRDCLQSYALTSGDNHFKCANCNDKTAITKELHKMGFYIPIQDAEWESADHSGFYGYEDMYEKNRKKRCDVKVCQLGRDVDGGEGSQTEVILCVLCGTNGCHVKCAGLGDEEEFRCEDCGGRIELERDQRANQRRSVGETSATSSLLEDTSVERDSSVDISLSSDLSLSSLNTTGDSGDSLQDVNEFVKQFELGSGLSSSKLFESSDDSMNQSDISEDSVQDVNEFVKQFELGSGLSSSILLETSDESILDTPDNESSFSNCKENFLKSTETVSKLLGDLTRSDKKVEKEKDPKSTLGTVHLFSNEQKSPVKVKNSKIWIRPDLFSSDAPELNDNILDNSVWEDETSDESIKEVEDGKPIGEISDKKRSFACKLDGYLKTSKKATTYMNHLVRSKYLVGFYESMVPENVKKEQAERESTKSPMITDTFSLDIVDVFNSPTESPNPTGPASPLATLIEDTESSVIISTVEEAVELLQSPSAKPVEHPIEEPRVDEPAMIVKYKPGPRSRTKPHLAPVRVMPQDLPLVSSSEAEADLLPTKESDESSASLESDIIRYKPGPKSRKKYLTVKESESIDKTATAAKLLAEETRKAVESITLMELDDSPVSSPKRKANDLDEKSPKKQKQNDENMTKEDSIEDIQSFIRDTEPVQEVAPAPPNQEALDRRRAKRPFQCPVCEGFFRAEMVLQQHMAKIHFWEKLRAMPRETMTPGGPMWQCSEFPCQYQHTRAEVVSGHMATEHKVVFRIAKSLFPSFTLPQRSPTITQVTIEDDEDDVMMIVRSPSPDLISNNNNNNSITSTHAKPPPPAESPSPLVPGPPLTYNTTFSSFSNPSDKNLVYCL